MTTLYERIGGPGAVTAAVEDFTARVWADPVLLPFFAGVDRRALKRHQRELLEEILDGRPRYSGRSLGEAHAGMDIDAATWNRTVGHLLDALRTAEVGEGDVAAVATVVEGHRAAIVTVGP